MISGICQISKCSPQIFAETRIEFYVKLTRNFVARLSIILGQPSPLLCLSNCFCFDLCFPRKSAANSY